MIHQLELLVVYTRFRLPQKLIFQNFCTFLFLLQNPAAQSPLGQMPPQDGMPGGPIPPGFFPVSIFFSSSVKFQLISKSIHRTQVHLKLK